MSNKTDGDKLIALSTYLKNNGLSQSKDLIKRFEGNVIPDNIVIKKTKQYKVKTIEQSIKKLKLKFKAVVVRNKVQKNTFIVKDGREFIMVTAELDLLQTPYIDHKCVAQFDGQDVFLNTRAFLSIAKEIDKKDEVMDFREPVFRSMMKMLIGSKNNLINHKK